MEGGKVVLVCVDATKDQPVRFKGEAFIRIGTYKKKLREHPEKERKLWNIPKKTSFEMQLASKPLPLEEVLGLVQYEACFELLDRAIPSTKEAIIDKFEEEGFVQRKAGDITITNLGALLFAKNLNDFEALSRKGVRVIFYNGDNRVHTKYERAGEMGYAAGFKNMIQYILDRIPYNEVIEKAIRKNAPVFPEIAIREIIANAVIHQDLEVRGASPMVEVFSNRMEVTNPGKPVINVDRFIDHSPESRNEKLASFLRRAGICEERGSGIDKVINSVEVYQLPPPNFTEGDNYTRVILSVHKPFREMDRVEKIRATYQHCCLRYVSGQLMTNQSLRERFGIEEQNYSTVSRIIRETNDAGWIKYHDPDSSSKKYAKYVPFWA